MKTDLTSSATKDFFAYFLAYFPDFPAEDQMDGSQALETLLSGVENARGLVTEQETSHWGELCMDELAKAGDALGRGDNDRVEKAVKAAREYFEYFLTRRKHKSEFVSGENGTVVRR